LIFSVFVYDDFTVKINLIQAIPHLVYCCAISFFPLYQSNGLWRLTLTEHTSAGMTAKSPPRGVYLAPSAFEAGFVSAAHGPEEISATLAAAHDSLQQLR